MNNSTLFDELKPFSGTGFREYYKKYLYIHCRVLLGVMFPEKLDPDVTGIFAYCYIDKTEGISFRPTSLAALTEYSIKASALPHSEDTIYILRLRNGNVRMDELHQNSKHMYLYALDPCESSFLDSDVLNVPKEVLQLHHGSDSQHETG